MAVLDRLTFIQQLPILLKGTSDDDNPCPGYLYEEIAKISHESPGSCRCLLEYLLNRLQSSSCHVKLKVLKILLYLCTLGSAQFVQDLRRNASFIQEAADVGGPPDPLHGVSLYQKVRATAQDVVGSLYSDASSRSIPVVTSRETPHAGMGTQTLHPLAMQGFGYSQEKPDLGVSSDTLLGGIQRAAVKVTHAVLAGSTSASPCISGQADDSYKPVTVPTENWKPSGVTSPLAHNVRVTHRTGVPGGGWDETDSGHSSQESSHGKSSQSQSSEAGSKSGSDGQSKSNNRETSETTDRVEHTHLGDCVQEAQLVWAITRGNKVFLTQEEMQHFVRGCSMLNCEVVFEMLNHSLLDDCTCVKLRSMCAMSSLMTSDLLSHDHMFAVVRQNLQKLSGGSPGPVTHKATKILRQFEALTQTSSGQRAANQITVATPPPCPTDILSHVNPWPEEEGILQPFSIPSSPTPASVGTIPDVNGVIRKIEAEEDSQSVCPLELNGQSAVQGCVSLFDGMEIVHPLGNTDLVDLLKNQSATIVGVRDRRTSEAADSRPHSSSVFSFLNS
ncbi:Hypothetical predicted protein [Pelobates cultripes]|uniref:AP-4 complex accessory subunit Tepsin n=1 Tax=Pelobates cultripes TaxID=61616 RepID=A0AAD1S7J7_PELCU|nr:Hypothetical predicted protein [Pelobates cultripes]